MGKMLENIREIKVVTIYHKNTDLMVAFSDDLKGLFVSGRSEDDLREKIPKAIQELFEAEGIKVISVSAEHDDESLPSSFKSPGFMARASLECL